MGKTLYQGQHFTLKEKRIGRMTKEWKTYIIISMSIIPLGRFYRSNKLEVGA